MPTGAATVAAAAVKCELIQILDPNLHQAEGERVGEGEEEEEGGKKEMKKCNRTKPAAAAVAAACS